MMVEVQHKGCTITGLKVGVNNVRRYFPKDSSSVDLQLDHLHIQCDLQPAFWQNEPQISDPRLTAWLEAKNSNVRRERKPVVMAMVPTEKRSFRLQMVSPRAHAGAAAVNE